MAGSVFLDPVIFPWDLEASESERRYDKEAELGVTCFSNGGKVPKASGF